MNSVLVWASTVPSLFLPWTCEQSNCQPRKIKVLTWWAFGVKFFNLLMFLHLQGWQTWCCKSFLLLYIQSPQQDCHCSWIEAQIFRKWSNHCYSWRTTFFLPIYTDEGSGEQWGQNRWACSAGSVGKAPGGNHWGGGFQGLEQNLKDWNVNGFQSLEQLHLRIRTVSLRSYGSLCSYKIYI